MELVYSEFYLFSADVELTVTVRNALNNDAESNVEVTIVEFNLTG